MKKYDNYKDSGIEWIGMIPEHWELKKIKHTTYVKGRIGWQGLRSDEFLEEAESLVVTGTDFIDGKINWKTCYQIPIERYNEDINIQLKENDLLITKDGTIGKVSLVKNMPKIATLNSGIFLTRPSTVDYITEYMYWVLVSEVFKTFYDFNKSGSTIQHLYQYVFNEFSFTKPSKEEQSQIANYLNHKTTQIDTLISKKQQFITLLEEERIVVINQAVTKGLDPKVKMKDSGIEWLGEIPEHWEVGKFNLLVNIRHGHQFMNYDFTESGIRIIKITQLHKNGYLDISNCSFISSNRLNEFSSIIIKENDILMCLTGGTIGKIIRVGKVSEPLLQNYRVGHFSSNDLKKIIDDYIFWVMSSDSLISQIFFQMRETGQPNIGMGDFSRMKISFPSITEQIEIVNYIKNKTKEIDTIISKSEQEIELLKEYKTALISEVVTGKVDVREEVLN